MRDLLNVDSTLEHLKLLDSPKPATNAETSNQCGSVSLMESGLSAKVAGSGIELSNTPRTDEAAGYDDGSGCWKSVVNGDYVPSDFARQLETELNAAKEEIDRLKQIAYGYRPIMETGISEIIARLEAECDSLKIDMERLDWLEDINKTYWIKVQKQPSGEVLFDGCGPFFREAIDSAMK